MAGQVSLSLSAAERAVLAEQGVMVTSAGLRSRSGAVVSVGVAAAMLLAKGPIKDVIESAALSRGNIREGGHLLDHDEIEPGNFDRPYLREGHAAERPQLLGGVPFTSQGAQARPDASDGLHAEDVDWDDLDEVDGAGVEKRAVTPFASQFHRRYLARDHSADSPANTGRTPVPRIPASRPAEPEQFHRSYLAGDADPSPADGPPNNPAIPATPGSVVYQVAAVAYNRNQARSRAEHVGVTGVISSQPAPAQYAPPAGLNASEVPHPVNATAPAPGER